MRPSARPGVWVGIFLVTVSVVQAETYMAPYKNEVYGKLGGEVSLNPGTDAPISRIVWKEGPNFAMESEGNKTDAYRQFLERGHLNTSTGVMTIKGLTTSDSGVYTPEINNVKGSPHRLKVISGVPVPTLSKTCDDDMSKCVVTCVGDTAGANPVTVVWKSDDNVLPDSSEMSIVIKKEESFDIKEFSCELQNPVSRERSKPITNPFTSGPRISSGIIVFVCLLVSLLLLVVFHRVKAGAWFFDKGSMPWEADFWQKSQAPREAAESNGNTAHQQTPNEETPMR